MNQLVSIDNFSLYLNDIKQYKTLSEEEIKDLFKQYSESDDQSYIKKIVLHNLRFVVHIAKQYRNDKVSLSDLVQEGNIGLLKSIKNYDYTRENSFITYAAFWIKAEILQYINKNFSSIRLITSKDHRKIFFNRTKFFSYTRPLTPKIAKQISKDMNVSFKSVYDMEQRLSFKQISIHKNDDSDNNIGIEDMLEAEGYDPSDIVINEDIENHDNNKLSKCLSYLNDRERDIIIKRWLNPNKQTLEELSQYYKVSRERIRQIENEAIRKMGIKYHENS